MNSSLVVPQISIAEARVFVAEDNDRKMGRITESLEECGLHSSVIAVSTMPEAVDYIDSQVAGRLGSNIFLLDGHIGPYSPMIESIRQGNHLAHLLLEKYMPREPERNDEEELKALDRMRTEALIIGISSTSDGKIDIGQIPQMHCDFVGYRILRVLGLS